MRKKILPVLGALMLIVAVASCAPIQATSAVSQADDKLEDAERAGAHTIAPGEKFITMAQLEYQLAWHYVDKSRQLQGFAKYDAAEFYARKAAELCQKAVEHMEEQRKRQQRRREIKEGKVFHRHK